MAVRRFEFTGIGEHGEDSSKWWEIELIPARGVQVDTGASREFFVVRTSYGSLRYSGKQFASSEFETMTDAQKFFDKKIKEKTRKGYDEVTA